MGKIHYFQRYSSTENTVTNNTLQLLARIYDYSPAQASKFLTEITGESIEIGVEINQQGRAKGAIPDGAIIQRSFKILIEAKVDARIEVDQLIRHARTFTNEAQKILLLLTRENLGSTEEKAISREILENTPGVVFKSITYEGVCKAITGLFKEYEYEMSALTEDYIQYCNDTNLFDQSKYLLRIVPCGESIAINKQFGIYFHPADRGYTKHSFVGIYADKAVQSVWEIDSVFDIEFDGLNLKKVLIQGRNTDEYDSKIKAMVQAAKTVCGYDVRSGSRFFCGSPKDTFYEKVSSGGIQRARFVNLRETIGQFTDAADVAAKLQGRKWE